jgi:tRNA(Ile)-lysidine synthase
LPALRAENPAIDEALLRLARSAREWTEVIDALAAPWSRLPIDCPGLARHPAAVVKRALALALDDAGVGYEAIHLDRLAELVRRSSEGQLAIDLPGARLVRVYDQLDRARPEPPGAATPTPTPEGYVVRAWRAGDRMRPVRLNGRSRKLSDLYGDAKVPRARRDGARVMVRVADGAIVWAEHLGVAFGEPPDLAPEPRHSGGSF